MKKELLYSFVAMASLMLASCNGDYDDWASPQANSAETAAAKYGVTFSNGPEATTAMPDADGVIQLVTLSSTNTDITGYTVKSITVNGETIDATMDGSNITVDAVALDKLIEKQYNSRAAKARDMKVVSTVTINLASGDAVTVDVAGETSGTFTPYATPAIDSKGYYMLGGFAENGGGWDNTKPVWMTDNGDGTYTATVNTTSEGDNWFKFYMGSDFVSGDWDSINKGAMGCETNGDNSRNNFLVYPNDPLYTGGVQTAVISGQGTYKVTLDMNNLTYSVVRAEAQYYIIGNPNGWSVSDYTCMAYALGNNTYSYTTQFTNQWDLKILEAKYMNLGDNSWGHCWGGVNGSTDATGSLVNTDAGAIGPSTTGGWYTFTFNMNTQTYSWTAVTAPTTTYTNVSLIGDFNGWGGDVDLTALAKAPHNWYVRATISKDGGLKFRANHDWATSWGTVKGGTIGETYYAAPGTENITVPAGTYDFYFNDITGNFNIVAVK
jgi:hypothetical protein